MAPNIATNTSVSLDELLDFVRPRHHAILLTRRSRGGCWEPGPWAAARAPNTAPTPPVSLEEWLAFVRPRPHAILLPRRSDGGPQGSPLTCGVDDSGRIVVSTYPERAKTRNAQ